MEDRRIVRPPSWPGARFERLIDIMDAMFPQEFHPMEVFDIPIDDFNKDGFQDMVLGGNFYGVPPDQGRYDAGYGCLLLGDGTGTFAPVSLQNSGFEVTGEIRQIVSLQTASPTEPGALRAGETLVMVARNNDTVVIIRGRN